MGTTQKFGGPWTVEKLSILSAYLDFYITALKNQSFKKIYIDAFAGTGKIKIGNEEKYEIIDGSAKLALAAKEEFDEYIFIEKKKSFVKELKELVNSEFPERAQKVQIISKDCNEVLKEICETVNWRTTRAVLFLDPYAADLNWETLEAIAATQAIDVWYLFPFNATIRLMKKNGQIDESWRNKLNSILGDTSWETELYEEDMQTNFWNTQEKVRTADIESLKQYVEKRLKTIFAAVSPNSRVLVNSKASPLFLFCFAVSNRQPKAIGLAMKVANYILKD